MGSTRVTNWAQTHRRSFAFNPLADRCALDLTLKKFVEAHYRAGEGIAEVCNAIWRYVHTHRLPRRAAGFLFRTKQALAGWKVRCLGRKGQPSPWIATCAIAGWLASSRSEPGLHAARAVLMQQHGHLRPGKVLALRASDIHVVSRSIRALSVSGVAVTWRPRPESSEVAAVRNTKTNS